MTPPIPSSVQILGHRFTVDSSPEASKLLKADDTNGDCTADELLIRLDPTRPRSLVAQTLIHEVLHASWAYTSLRTKHEEDTITALSPLLLGVFRRNPEFVAFVVADDTADAA